MWKKQDLTTAEICCSMESSVSKVTPRVFTTLENGWTLRQLKEREDRLIKVNNSMHASLCTFKYNFFYKCICVLYFDLSFFLSFIYIYLFCSFLFSRDFF